MRYREEMGFWSKVRFKLNGVDAFCLERKFLVYNLLRRNLLVKYHRSFFGILWTLIAPMLTCLVFYVVFQHIVVVKIPSYLAFIVTGLFPWIFFSQTLVEATESIVNNASLVSRIPLPVQVFPLVSTLTNFVTLLLSLPVLIVVMLWAGISVQWTWVTVPGFLIILFLITYSIAWIFSFAFVFLRDLRHALGLILQVGFYASPIFYSTEMIPIKLQFLIHLNPLALILVGIRNAVIHGKVLPQEYWPSLIAWSLVLFMAAIFCHRRVAGKVTEVL